MYSATHQGVLCIAMIPGTSKLWVVPVWLSRRETYVWHECFNSQILIDQREQKNFFIQIKIQRGSKQQQSSASRAALRFRSGCQAGVYSQPAEHGSELKELQRIAALMGTVFSSFVDNIYVAGGLLCRKCIFFVILLYCPICSSIHSA